MIDVTELTTEQLQQLKGQIDHELANREQQPQPTQHEQQEQRAQRRDGRVSNSQQASREQVTQRLPASDKMKDIKQECYEMLGVSNTQELKRHIDTSDKNLRKKADWIELHREITFATSTTNTDTATAADTDQQGRGEIPAGQPMSSALAGCHTYDEHGNKTS